MRRNTCHGGLALLVPAYNAERFLPRLLISARDQYIPFDEVWVYDDASTDATAQTARRLGAQVVEGKINRGPSYGRNALAQCTCSKWLHFHDADDALLPGFSALAAKYMTLDKHDVVLFDYEVREHLTDRLCYTRHFDEAALERDSIRFSIVEQINAIHGLYRRDTFLASGGFSPTMRYNEDPDLHLRLALANLRFTADSGLQIINYIRPDSISTVYRHECIAAQFETMCFAAREVGDRYAREIAENLWLIAARAAMFLDWPLADKAAAKALQLAGVGCIADRRLFQFLVRIDYRLALRLRELLVRVFKRGVRPARHRELGAAFGSLWQYRQMN
jgi:glycosyltransferase involved in cell wall biosynthesis